MNRPRVVHSCSDLVWTCPVPPGSGRTVPSGRIRTVRYQAQTKEPSMTQLPRTETDGFKAHFQGDVLLPGDVNYDEVRQIWNAMIDRRPALIARCVVAGRCRPGRQVRAQARPARLDPRRRPQHRGQCRLRRWPHDRPVANEERAGATRRPAGRPSSPAALSPTSTRPRRRTASPRRWASIRPRASPA